MNWKDSIRQIKTTENVTGIQLLKRFLDRSHNSPGIPPQGYDGDDVMPLLRRLQEPERVEFNLPSTEVLGTPESTIVPFDLVTPAQPIYQIRVHALCCSDDDGKNGLADPATVSQWMGAAIKEANAIYAAKGAGIEFQFDPGDVSSIKSTMVNQDFTVPAGTNMKTGKDHPPLTKDQTDALGAPHEAERNKVCSQFTDRCVFLLAYGTSLSFNAVKGQWETGPRDGYAYSWENKEFVAFPATWGALHGPEVAHESGHYLHLWHTHSYTPKTVDEAAKLILDQVNKKSVDKNNAATIFDGDLGSGVNDTPPDPGPDFYASVVSAKGNACTVGVAPSIPVMFGNGASVTYQINCDRGDVMSYFKDCGTFSQHFTPDQITRMRNALSAGNRRRLVGTQLGDTQHPHLRYSALWDQGQTPTVWWEACTESELRAKTGELWPSMRLKQMTGFVLDGQVRYSCIWTPGTYPQVWWPNCSDAEFRQKTGELWGSMRVAQVHAFVVGNEVRYSALWNAGTQPQVWWENCSEQEFRDKTGELWNTMRPKQVQGFVAGNQIRFSALWNAGTENVVWWPNCSEQEFRDKTGELWNTMRPATLSAVAFGNQRRFSATWRTNTMPQVWWPQCTEEQVRQKTGDLWSSMRPTQWMPVIV